MLIDPTVNTIWHAVTPVPRRSSARRVEAVGTAGSHMSRDVALSRHAAPAFCREVYDWPQHDVIPEKCATGLDLLSSPQWFTPHRRNLGTCVAWRAQFCWLSSAVLRAAWPPEHIAALETQAAGKPELDITKPYRRGTCSHCNCPRGYDA